MREQEGAVRGELGETARRTAAASRTGLLIVAAARTLFLERGYEAVTIDEIASAAGVSRMTVFNRFKTKDAVFRAMVDDHWQRWGKETRTAAVPHEAPVEDHLRAIALAIVAFQNNPQQLQFQRLIVSESRRLDWIGPAAYRTGKGPHMKQLARHLAKLHEEKRLDCPRADIAAWQFVGLVQEFLVWPKVMAMGDADTVPLADVVIDEAIATFMARYDAM